MGLSPHTRGNLLDDVARRRLAGSIPAHTGKPDGCRGAGYYTWVYPRTYGETVLLARQRVNVEGLSPHIRGNLAVAGSGPAWNGSIPAHTGKPEISMAWHLVIRVYPRTYGETLYSAVGVATAGGLSPHIRGNQLAFLWACGTIGSIPAHTGKPPMGSSRMLTSRVYPRTYGETAVKSAIGLLHRGLSPHIRGNRLWIHQRTNCYGSIPAHTGKPGYMAISECVDKVYPRTYGETLPCKSHFRTCEGLSPHIRGNLGSAYCYRPAWRSIPAHTGKPLSSVATGQRKGVYPRTYGETSEAISSMDHERGLSPHIRGNRWDVGVTIYGKGAHTGKPRVAS